MAKEEAQEFGREVIDNVDQLADQWKTSQHCILITASLMLCKSHAPNPANKHSGWYTANFPKKDGGKCNLDLYVDNYWMYCLELHEAYWHMICEDYQKWTARLSEEKMQKMQEIWDWVDNHSIGIINTSSYKSIMACMIGMQNQLTTSVSYLTSIWVLYW